MNKEAESHSNPLEQLQILFDGYFDGIIDEIDEETQQVGEWPQQVKLASKIKRKDQELDWLNRLKHKMQKVKTYVNSSIDKELKK